MPDATVELVTGLWEHMSDHYRTRLARKDEPEMQLVAKTLEAMGILDAEDFLSRFTTTIGRTIYTPYEIGVGSQREIESQLRTCVHEHQHVVQYIQGGAKFAFEYMVDSAKRAFYEADAFRCNLELHFWMHGSLPDTLPDALAQNLTHYGCTADDIAVCAKHLRMAARVVEQGGVSSDAGKVALAWLERHF